MNKVLEYDGVVSTLGVREVYMHKARCSCIAHRNRTGVTGKSYAIVSEASHMHDFLEVIF
jgi:hypothetical protein